MGVLALTDIWTVRSLKAALDTSEPAKTGELSVRIVEGADPILLALAIAFILAMGFLGLSFALPAASPFLRPPPIGPPTAA